MSDFEKAFKFILQVEGGYTNDPQDPGGETKYGITKASFPSLNIKELTVEQAKEIYHKHYWNKYNLDDYPFPLNIVLFDSYVNMRPKTVKKLFYYSHGDWTLLLLYRMRFYSRLANMFPRYRKFFRGWINRLTKLFEFVMKELHNEDLPF